MRKITFFIFIITSILFYYITETHCESELGSIDLGLRQDCMYWYDRGVKKRVWMATDEMALISRKTDRERDDVSFVQRLYPDAVITEKNNFVVYLKSFNTFDVRKAIRSLTNESLLHPVFYKGKEKKARGKMVLMNEIIVQYPQHMSEDLIISIEIEFGLEKLKQFGFAKNTFLYKTDSPFSSLDVTSRLIKSGYVNYAYPHWLRPAGKRAIPDDPLFQDQWHLKNTGQGNGTPGEDVNIVSAWDKYRGSKNEVIAIVDYDGMEIDHEDLSANVIADKCWDYIDGNNDPTPISNSDSHGTSCAGLAAGRGFNGIGICGAAPYAGLIGYRIPSELSDVNESLALSKNGELVDIYSNSWGPADPSYIYDSPVLEGPGELVDDAIKNGITNGRQGLGNIYIWAGGNGGEFDDNANYDGYANSRYTIAVAASTQDGNRAVYSEEGANIMVNVPAGTLSFGVTTTDLTGFPGDDYGNYTSDFGGTSVSSPLLAGITALMLEANPELSWRDVQHIIIETAKKNKPNDDDWTVNGAGYHINHKYGFGRVDAQAAVNAAVFWNSAPPEKTVEDSSSPDIEIPNNDSTGVTSSIFIEDNLKVEFVDIYFSAPDHNSWGDLEITLISPDGTKSVLAKKHYCDHFDRYENWRFGSVRHYGEYSRGNWSLNVKDINGEFFTGTLQSWGLKIYGTGSYSDGDLAPYGNRDGKVNVADALVALNFALGLSIPTAEDIKYGDVAPMDDYGNPDPDGQITVGDAIVILRKALGIISF